MRTRGNARLRPVVLDSGRLRLATRDREKSVGRKTRRTGDMAAQLGIRAGFEPRSTAHHVSKSHADRALRIEGYDRDATRNERLKTGAD